MQKYISVILCLLGLNLAAQEDSIRILSLQEIKLQAREKTQGQKLIHYFKGNLGFTLEEMLSRLPEMNFLRRGPYGMEPTIRSMGAGQINVLIDGMRIYGACTDKMDPATIYVEPANLDQIALSTGTQKAFSGSTVGGTVDLKIAEPGFSGKAFQLSVNSGFQSAANALNTTIRSQYRIGNLSILGSGTYRNANNYRSGGGEIIPFSGYEKINYSLSIKYLLNKHIYVKTDVLNDDGWNIGYPALPMDVGYASARIAAISMGNSNMAGHFMHWQLKIYHNAIKHFMDDTHRPNVPIHMDMPGESKTSGVFAESNWKMPAKHHLQTRIDYSLSDHAASMTMYAAGQLPMYMLTWPNHRKQQSGLSIQWRYSPDSLWRLEVGTRFDIVNYHLRSQVAKEEVSLLGSVKPHRNNLLNGSLGINRKIGKALNLGAAIQYGQRAPTGAELYGFYLFNRQDGHDYLGNPALRKENSLQSELVVTYQKKNMRLRVSTFYNHLGNYIFGIPVNGYSVMTIGAAGVKQNINLPHASLKGLEASILWNPIAGLQTVSTLKYTNGTLSNGDAIPMLQPLLNISSVKWNFKSLSLIGEIEAATAEKHFNTNYGEDYTSSYALLNIRVVYTFSMQYANVDIQSGVENITDKKYHQHQDWGNIPRPGRNIYVQLKISL